MRRENVFIGVVGILLSSSFIYAGGNVTPVEPVFEEVEVETSQNVSNSSAGVFVGTRGVGVEYSKRLGISPNTVMKFSAAGMTGLNTEKEEDGVNYDVDVDLATIGFTFDYHPFSNGFYMSAGGMYNGNKVSFKATPANSEYTINGHTYAASDIGYIKGETDFNPFVPYAGIGYDNSLFGDGNWFFTARAGVMYQGKSNVKLTYECGDTMDTANCNSLKNDVAQSEATLNEETDDFQLLPDVSVGVAYRF
jgi:hypothetical protein